MRRLLHVITTVSLVLMRSTHCEINCHIKNISFTFSCYRFTQYIYLFLANVFETKITVHPEQLSSRTSFTHEDEFLDTADS